MVKRLGRARGHTARRGGARTGAQVGEAVGQGSPAGGRAGRQHRASELGRNVGFLSVDVFLVQMKVPRCREARLPRSSPVSRWQHWGAHSARLTVRQRSFFYLGSPRPGMSRFSDFITLSPL